MEKGTFQPQINSSLDFVEEEILKIPVPDQIHNSERPFSNDTSVAMNTLIEQNEDLLSRLNVNIRRSSILEETIHTLENQKKELVSQYDNLKDQILIYKKKDELFQSRNKKIDDKIAQLHAEIQLSETRYSEYYQTSKDQQTEYERRIKNLELTLFYQKKRLSKYIIYRTESQNKRRQYKNIIHDLSLKVKKTHKLLLDEEVKRKELQERLSETITHLQSSSKEHQAKLDKVIAEHYEQISKIRAKNKEIVQENLKQIQEKTEKIENLEIKLKNHNKTYEDNIELKNKIVFLERSHKETLAPMENQIEELQKGLAHYRQESKNKSIEFNKLNTELKKTTELNKNLNISNKKLVDQLESLQLLWKDLQQELESEKQKKESLQKLNQRLSQKLQSTRFENKKLTDKKEDEQLHLEKKSLENNKEKVNQLFAEIQAGIVSLDL